MRGYVGFVALSLVLSGCAGGSAAPEGAAPEATSVVEASAQEFGGDTGTLEVLVVDDSVQPISGATVGIEGIAQTATTNEAGLATFRGLPAGPHKLFAAALGYESVGRSVTVTANEVQSETLTLVAIAAVDAVYTELFIFKGFMPCGFGLVVVTVTASCPTGSQYRVVTDTVVTSGILTFFDEVVWQQASALSAERLRLATGKNETCNPCSFQQSYGGATSVSPLIYRRDAEFKGINDAEDPEEELKIRHRIWVPGSNNGLPIVVIEQGFEIYSTIFYGEPAPDTFPGSRPDA